MSRVEVINYDTSLVPERGPEIFFRQYLLFAEATKVRKQFGNVTIGKLQ